MARRQRTYNAKYNSPYRTALFRKRNHLALLFFMFVASTIYLSCLSTAAFQHYNLDPFNTFRYMVPR